jgi:hypothetical protein
MSESGLRSTIGNRVYATSVSGVRIPISPPVIFRKRLFWALSFSAALCAAATYSGRVAERLNAAVSKTVLPVLPVTRVQIPPLPPGFEGSACGRPFFIRNAMTLRGKLTVQLPLQAGLTCEARLAPTFAASALVSFPLADLLAHARIFVCLFGFSFGFGLGVLFSL